MTLKLKRILTGYDFWAAAAIAFAAHLLFPTGVPNDLAKDYYGIGISVLSIVFSVFFAALAVIMTVSDDDFVNFLEEDGAYTALVWNFKFSTGLLFVALVASLIFYAYSAKHVSDHILLQGRAFVVLFAFVFFWGLFAAVQSIFDAIKYSQYRAKYLSNRRPNQ